MNHEIAGLRIRVKGIVQGVGFRPFVFSLARHNHLTGFVRNTSNGVEIELAGLQPGIEQFLTALRENPPPLARIDQLDAAPCEPGDFTTFEIHTSQAISGDFMPVAPDVSICPDCLRELLDPADRRYRYPFINCTNCGPRFTIVKDIPYDRPFTTMAGFPLCPDCEKEYHDPLDRRFHAQPIACPVCGPQLSFQVGGNRLAEGEEALQMARDWIKQGRILAVKGLGGYHLAWDASNPAAVDELRRRKKRSDKPFALMAYDLGAIERHCIVSDVERDCLASRERPIVLLKRKPETLIAAEVAPGLTELGIMLAYTPLHVLLLEPQEGFPDLLVMTSGNDLFAWDDYTTSTPGGALNGSGEYYAFQNSSRTRAIETITAGSGNDLVNLTINDEDQGTFNYPRYAPTSTNDSYLTVTTDTSSSEFDYVELRSGIN